MDLVNPAVTDGVHLFVNIVIFLIAFGAAVSFVDLRNTHKKKNKDN